MLDEFIERVGYGLDRFLDRSPPLRFAPSSVDDAPPSEILGWMIRPQYENFFF